MPVAALTAVVGTLLVIQGCGHWSRQGHRQRLQGVEEGMSRDQVAERAGMPDQKGSVPGDSKSYTAWHYCDRSWWQGKVRDPANDRQRCTSLYFDGDRLMAVGTRAFVVSQRVAAARVEVQREYDRKRMGREAQQRHRRQVRANARSQREAVLQRRQEEKWRQRHETTLYRQVLKVPASDHRRNFELYDELSRLNPGKDLYRQKREHYRRLVKQDAAAAVAIQRFTATGADLRVTAQILSNRGLFVWVENTGDEAVRCGPRSFRLIDAGGKVLRPVIDPELIGSIAPDQQRMGRIGVPNQSAAQRLVFRPEGQAAALNLELR